MLLRAAALEAAVANRLARDMFQPLFPWSSTWNPEFYKLNQFEQIAEDLLETDPPKEAILRQFMSSIELREGQAQKDSIIRSILEDMTQICAPIFESQPQNRRSAFQHDLREFLVSASEAWKHAQRSQFRATATIKFKEGSDWDERIEYDNATSEVHSDTTQVPVMVLFPQVYCCTPTESHKAIYPGVVLWSDQVICTSGKKEYDAQYRRISSANREDFRGTAGRRRQSNAGGKVNRRSGTN
jgi:hypothetical protein